MDSEEREIFLFLKAWGAEYVGYLEIARRAGGKKKFQTDAEWAEPLLCRMQQRGVLESDALGRYRIKPISAKDKATRWVSPDIAKILGDKGIKIEGVTEAGTDEYYDRL